MRRSWPEKTATDSEKAAGIVKIDGDILRLEVMEERIICSLETDGVSMSRRGDLDPRVFFEVTDDE